MANLYLNYNSASNNTKIDKDNNISTSGDIVAYSTGTGTHYLHYKYWKPSVSSSGVTLSPLHTHPSPPYPPNHPPSHTHRPRYRPSPKLDLIQTSEVVPSSVNRKGTKGDKEDKETKGEYWCTRSKGGQRRS